MTRRTLERPTLPDSFRYHVDGDCWVWDGYCDKNGYARIYDRAARVIVWAHRYSYEVHTGPIPAGHEIDHTCQRTDCVNPAHLDAVTRAEHVRRTFERLGKNNRHLAAAHFRRMGLTYAEIAAALDYAGRAGAASAVQAALTKGLLGAGEIPTINRLTDVEREEIRDLAALTVPLAVIGELYGVHNSQVSRIVAGRTSGHSPMGGAA